MAEPVHLEAAAAVAAKLRLASGSNEAVVKKKKKTKRAAVHMAGSQTGSQKPEAVSTPPKSEKKFERSVACLKASFHVADRRILLGLL